MGKKNKETKKEKNEKSGSDLSEINREKSEKETAKQSEQQTTEAVDKEEEIRSNSKVLSREQKKRKKRKQQNKKKKRRRKDEEEQFEKEEAKVNQIGKKKEAASQYLKGWKQKDENEWKFKKNIQHWLNINAISPSKLVEEDFEIYCSYLQTMQGNARDKTKENAQKALEQCNTFLQEIAQLSQAVEGKEEGESSNHQNAQSKLEEKQIEAQVMLKNKEQEIESKQKTKERAARVIQLLS